ncbi:hypothetical protein [Thermocatellispora tengchongensis]|uniref:hypothetical protein n=1 Tax=Thermocatellispora tengchongensis TaxID=1073253 RepID=UPI00363AC32F
MRVLKRAAAAGLVAAALIAGGCAAPSGEGGAGDDTFVVGLSSEYDTLSPVLGFAPDGGSLIYDGLMSRAPDLSLRPALAESAPRVSADGKTVTFRLRQGCASTTAPR